MNAWNEWMKEWMDGWMNAWNTHMQETQINTSTFYVVWGAVAAAGFLGLRMPIVRSCDSADLPVRIGGVDGAYMFSECFLLLRIFVFCFCWNVFCCCGFLCFAFVVFCFYVQRLAGLTIDIHLQSRSSHSSSRQLSGYIRSENSCVRYTDNVSRLSRAWK